MRPSAIGGASRCAPARAVHPTDLPAVPRRGFARLTRSLGFGVASGGQMGAVHGVAVTFHCHPAPHASLPLQWLARLGLPSHAPPSPFVARLCERFSLRMVLFFGSLNVTLGKLMV